MKTFKQFLDEEGREIYAKQLGAVADFSPELAEKNYRVGKVTFSASDGMGSVPFNQSVYYHGCVALCRPSMFHKLVLPFDEEREDTAKHLVELIGEGYAMGIPFLNISLQGYEEDGEAPKVMGHEGRARMLAVKQLNGDEPVPIHLFLNGGLRARDLTPDLIAAIKGRMQVERSPTVINSPFEGLYVNGKTA